MARKKAVPAPDIIHDLSGHLEYKIVKVIQAVKDKQPGVFLIEARRQAPQQATGGSRSKKRTSESTATCILKALSPIMKMEHLYQAELAANSELVRSIASNTPEEACEAFFSLLSQPATERWPRCLGRVQVPANKLEQSDEWIRATDELDVKLCRGLLFEYFPDITPLTNEMLNEEHVADIMNIVTDLHTYNVLHRDFKDHAAWPNIAFGNIYLRRNASTGKQEPVILDFDRAKVMTDSVRDRAMLQAEKDELADLLERAMTNRLAIDHVPKEVQKLLS